MTRSVNGEAKWLMNSHSRVVPEVVDRVEAAHGTAPSTS
jgi:hypothetical protein